MTKFTTKGISHAQRNLVANINNLIGVRYFQLSFDQERQMRVLSVTEEGKKLRTYDYLACEIRDSKGMFQYLMGVLIGVRLARDLGRY